MNTPLVPEKLYTARDVADRFHVHLVTVRKWVQSGRIGCYKIGRTTRFSEAHLAAMLTEHPAEEARR